MMKRAFDTLDLDNANIASVSDAISRRLVVTGAVCFFSLGLCFLAFVMNWTLSLSSSFSRAFLILSVAMAGLALVATLLQLGRLTPSRDRDFVSAGAKLNPACHASTVNELKKIPAPGKLLQSCRPDQD